jgi:hypothetical protein
LITPPEIVARILDNIVRSSIPDFQGESGVIRSAFEMMSSALRWKSRAHAWMKLNFAAVGDQRRFTREHVDQFILSAMAMVERGLATRRKGGEIDPEPRKAEHISQRTKNTPR